VSDPIKFLCTVEAVKTTVDKGIRIYLDLPETAIMQAAMLMECKRMQVALDITALPYTANEQAGDTPDGKKGRGAVKSLRGS
jgi:hypothetical protein